MLFSVAWDIFHVVKDAVTRVDGGVNRQGQERQHRVGIGEDISATVA